MEERRAKSKAQMAYKIQHSLVGVPHTAYRPVPDHHHTRGQSLYLPYCRTIQYQHSYIPSSIRLWNRLPASVTSQPSLEQFRTALAAVTLT